MSAMIVANVFMLLIMTSTVKYIAKIALLPKTYILPCIMMFCVIGSFAQANRMFDVWVLLFFGVVGYAMRRASIPQAPFIIGLVLAPIAEQNLRTGLQMTGDSLMPLVTRPVSRTFLLISILFLLWPWKYDFKISWGNKSILYISNVSYNFLSYDRYYNHFSNIFLFSGRKIKIMMTHEIHNIMIIIIHFSI